MWVVRCALFVVRCWLLVVVGCGLRVGCCLEVAVVCRLVFVDGVGCPLIGVRCSVVCWLLLVVHWLLFVVCCCSLLFVV